MKSANAFRGQGRSHINGGGGLWERACPRQCPRESTAGAQSAVPTLRSLPQVSVGPPVQADIVDMPAIRECFSQAFGKAWAQVLVEQETHGTLCRQVAFASSAAQKEWLLRPRIGIACSTADSNPAGATR